MSYLSVVKSHKQWGDVSVRPMSGILPRVNPPSVLLQFMQDIITLHPWEVKLYVPEITMYYNHTHVHSVRTVFGLLNQNIIIWW